MPLWIAEYLADTRRLSTLEHGIYLLLIMEYWRNGGLPSDDSQLARIAGITPQEWRKHRPSIKPFFQDGWKHKRIDKELAESAEKSSSAKRAANERWEKEKNRIANAHANAHANASTAHAKRMSEAKNGKIGASHDETQSTDLVDFGIANGGAANPIETPKSLKNLNVDYANAFKAHTERISSDDAFGMPLQSQLHPTHPSDAPGRGREAQAETLEQKCRKLVGEEPVLIDPNFVVLADCVGTDGIIEGDVIAGIQAAMATPGFRLKHWKSLIGWARTAAKNRLEGKPKSTPPGIPADPTEPMVDMGWERPVPEKNVIFAIRNLSAAWLNVRGYSSAKEFRRDVAKRAPHLMKFWPEDDSSRPDLKLVK